MASEIEIKEKYKSYRRNGGIPSKISKTAEDVSAREIYHLVHSFEMRDADGRRFTLAEKFDALGIQFTQRKFPFDQKVLMIRQMLDDFVKAGGDVNDLKKVDPEYQEVHGIKMTDESGRRLTVEEKFLALGHPRGAKMSTDVRGDLIAAIQKYLDDKGDIYIPKAKLPFYRAEYASYARTRRGNGAAGELAFQTNLRELGFDYSEMYFQFRKILELPKFKDADGFVDDYRKDIKMDNFVKTSAYKLGLPIPVFVGLVGNADLRGCYLDAEYFGFVRRELELYLKQHKNFVGMSKIDKPLYEKVRHVRRMAFSADGQELTTDDVLCLLGFEDVESDLGRVYEKSDVRGILNNLRPIASKNGGKLSRKDIPEGDYRKLIGMIAATGATTKAFFNLYDINYDGKDGHRLAKVWVNGYPFMQEMRAERDRILSEQGLSMTGDCKKEDLFDALIVASVDAFEKYKAKIFNFVPEKIERTKATGKKNPSAPAKKDGGKA